MLFIIRKDNQYFVAVKFYVYVAFYDVSLIYQEINQAFNGRPSLYSQFKSNACEEMIRQDLP